MSDNAEILKTTDDGKLRVRLVIDPDCDNPRNSDSLAYVVNTPDRRYTNIDSKPGPLSDTWNRMVQESENPVEEFIEWANKEHGATTLLDTSGSGGMGVVWYLLPKDTKDMTDLLGYLKCEAKEYRRWADGETYGYIIERAVEWTNAEGGKLTTWEQIEDGSCWGFIGFEYAQERALEALSDES